MRSVLLRVVFFAQLFVLALVARQWAYVTTHRLYLDHAQRGHRTAVAQRFDLDGGRVVPRIAARGASAVSFATLAGEPVALHADVESTDAVRYEVAWYAGAARHVLAAGVAGRRTAIARAVPGTAELVELSADGPVTWSDPRLVRTMHVGRHGVALILLTLVLWLLYCDADPNDRDALRRACFKSAALGLAFVVPILACEAALRALGNRAPAGVLALRRDLGEAVPDDRWEDTARYGRRLRAGVRAENAWQYGDIVRMGFVSPMVSPGLRRHFPFATDAEGFRNDTVRERVSIAALGDSFTDALTVPADASWPMRLQQRLRVSVQNYGTAGFGPQQELLVLRDFALRHRPSHVVLAYFAGNDLFDAERFDDFQRGHPDPSTLGWQVKDVYDRADTWFVASAVTASANWLARSRPPSLVGTVAAAPADSIIPAAAPFDEGLFTLQVHGRTLQWSFMPPYLNTLNFSEQELRGRRGWRLTREAVLAMQQSSRNAGADFTVMFLPFKSQVYWPMLERRLTASDLHRALEFHLKDNGRPVDAGTMRRNRLAQNAMLKELCESAGIPFLDTTPLLERRVELGENVYFPDDSHLNELGQRLVADALADFLLED